VWYGNQALPFVVYFDSSWYDRGHSAWVFEAEDNRLLFFTD
jgi:hypothetical protein